MSPGGAARSSVRLPLQTGGQALGMLMIAAVLFGATLLASLIVLAMVLVKDVEAKFKLLVIVPILFGTGAIVALRRAFALRATDIVIDDDGITIEGGKDARRAIAWGDLDPEKCRVVEDRAVSLTVNGDTRYLHVARLTLKSGERLAIGSSLDHDEVNSLIAVMDTLLARLEPEATERADATDEGSRIVACPSCRAPAVPVDEPAARCRFCGADVPMPAEVRERLRAGLALAKERVHAEALVRELLAQPSARSTNRALVVAAVAMLLSLPLSLISLAWDGGWIVAFGAIWALVRRVRVHLADRTAIFALTFGLAARPASGGAFHCRRCDAPLPSEDPPRAVERCVYCATDNVTGVRVQRALERTTRQDRELETVLATRRRERLKARLIYALAIGVVIYGLSRAKRVQTPPVTHGSPGASASGPPSASLSLAPSASLSTK